MADNTLINSSIEIINGDIFQEKADLLVIPCSTANTISDPFRHGLDKLQVQYVDFLRSTTTRLGEVRLQKLPRSDNFYNIAYVTSVDNFSSNIESIEEIGRKLGNLCNENNIKRIATPVLGTGAGGLNPKDSYKFFIEAFNSTVEHFDSLRIVVNDEKIYNTLNAFIEYDSKELYEEKEESSDALINSNSHSRNGYFDSKKSFDFDIPEEKEVEQNKTDKKPLYNLGKILSNDVWAEKDKLGYECYAKVISEMIKEECSQTLPPLTIALLAPWGQGKTTLMRYIERNLKEARLKASNTKTDERKIKSKSTLKKTSIEDVLGWLKELPLPPTKLSYPTIWFNPWKHQNCEQIWAGMAQSIITQIVEYLPEEEQEKFWFRLNLKRIDIAALKSKIFKNIITSFIQNLTVGVIILSFLLFLGILSIGLYLIKPYVGVPFKPITDVITWVLSIVGFSFPSIRSFAESRKKTLEENLKDKFTEIVAEPDYNKKAGYFKEVEDDMARVFDILVSCDKPAVIFIDDLDRCSPDILVEVIEAINLIINGDYRNKCYFVIGMDAKMVAASLDKKYTALSDKFEDEKNRFGDIGYYFLDKFIQLPFIIPVIKEEDRKNLLLDLFTGKKEIIVNTKLTEEQKKSINDLTYNNDSNSVKAKETEKLIKENAQAKIQFLESKVQQTAEDSPELVEQLLKFGSVLGNSPRSIKRFVNMFRFYYSYQELRRLEEKTYASVDVLARWLVLSVRCPQMIRFIQWEVEEKFINSSTPHEKAERFDNLINDFKNKQGLNNNSLESKRNDQWTKYIDELKIPEFNWLKEKDTMEILLMNNSTEDSLTQALACNVW